MKKVDFDPIIGHEDEWVALTPDRKKIIDSDKDFKILCDRLEKKGISKNGAALHYVLPPGIYSF